MNRLCEYDTLKKDNNRSLKIYDVKKTKCILGSVVYKVYWFK